MTSQEVQDLEAKWQLPVCKVRHFGPGNRTAPNPNEVASVLNLVSEQLWAHRLRQKQQQASLNTSLI